MAMLAPHPRPPPPTTPSMPLLARASFRPSPVKRRSTIKRSIDEIDMTNTPSSPSKRSRVTFDSNVEVVSADDEDDIDPLVVREQVRWAIQRHFSGDDESFQRIQSLFSTSPMKDNAPSSRTLRIHLQAVLANVSTLNKSCTGLVDAVLYSEWIGRNDAYFELFMKFMGNLTAAQGGYLGKCVHMLVDLLGPQKTRRLKEAKAVRQPKIHQRVLQALRYMARLIPAASGIVADAVKRKLSYDFAKAEERVTYIKNFMQLIAYVPELTSDILSNVMNELVKLDVAIQSELDDEDDEVEEEMLNPLPSSQTLVSASLQHPSSSTLDTAADDASTSDESDMEDRDDLDPVQVQRRRLKEDVQQVDLIMDILFHYYTRQVSSSVKGQHDTIDQLIAQFHNIILPTYRSRHPQFLIFHFAQTSPLFIDQFVTSCIRVLVDKKQPQILRHSAAAFFSGFVGRGVQVSPSVVQDCVELLCDQLNSLRKQYEPGCRGPDLKKYSDFYATTQAILYIFCFRWRDLASSSSDFDDDDSDVEEEEVEHFRFPEKLRDALNGAIFSVLNPLRVCTPVIVEQFAKITFALEFLYLRTKIEANKHVRLIGQWRSISDLNINQPDLDMSWAGDNGTMEGYFPYDPYRLPISKNWLEEDYIEWKGIPGEEQDDDEDEMLHVGVIGEEVAASEA